MDKHSLNGQDRQESSQKMPLPHSERSQVVNAQKIGPADPDEEMTVTVLVRRPSIDHLFGEKQVKQLSREEFAGSYGADQEDLKKVESFAKGHHLSVKEVNGAAGTIILSGKTADFNHAFGVQLQRYKHPNFTYRGHSDSIKIPKDLAGIIENVFGLDNRPQARTHFQILRETKNAVQSRQTSKSYTPEQVAQLYSFPTDSKASQQCIGIIELGGGYNPSELNEYFTELGIDAPVVIAVPVNGAGNQPTGDANGADGEVVLDIEVAGAVAPGVKIAVYFASNTDAGFLNAINKAVHDNENKPSVVSISWGSAESNWSEQAMQAMDRAFQDARALGVTICSAAGDRGSSDGVDDGLVHVDFPASSPNNLACGGTRLEGTGAVIADETVWNDGPDSSTGGGVSQYFALPEWQMSAQVPPSANPGAKVGRGVPDVAGNADPETGYRILVDGQRTVIGGTSAVAPLWAGLIALINQDLGRPVGFMNPTLYGGSSRSSLRDITKGNNDSSREANAYDARTGWDACTGMGSPIGTNLAGVFRV
ncbi:S53 family peptidase [Sporolactobacillus pectinivorans]|uniref:S53 family peptidase n=1 Tax=Sporolactobacillus pectinivorans TaxID=1591408 RepID=UPI000C26B111|nr:S53 family peptidase [Sporolactobacillus pectinivorans]